MRRRVLCQALVILGIAVSSGAFAQADPTPYSRPGTEAGLGANVESFLNVAAVLAKGDAEMFGAWCQQYRIDSVWPSVQRLTSVFEDVGTEYVSRLNEARETDTFKTPDGLDPNDWKNEAVGRVFGEVYEELLVDGWDMELMPFLLIIQADMGPTWTSYSDEPFTEAKKAYEEALFWKGLTEASAHARALQAEGGFQ